MEQELSISLGYTEGSSDKVYNVELKKQEGGYVVNFAYGRRGQALKTGTKTDNPLDYDAALKAFEKLVKSKTSKGYKEEGNQSSSGQIQVVSDKTDTGIRPQLLNEITLEEAEHYIQHPMYCAQEKFDGVRKMIQKRGIELRGINKKGFEVPLTFDCKAEMSFIGGDFILDGEDLGHKIMIFDNLTPANQHMMYKGRLQFAQEMLAQQDLDDCVQIVETAWTEDEKRRLFERLQQENAEGIVFKQITNSYTPGRPASGGGQYKCKFWESASVIVESQHPTKHSIGVCVVTDSARISIGNVTVKPSMDKPTVGQIVEVKYLYYNEGGSLIQPELLMVRDDVTMEECTLDKLKRPKQHGTVEHNTEV